MIPEHAYLKRRPRSARPDGADAGQKLWSLLRRRQLAGLQFRRHKPLGTYTVDFYCAAARLVVEVDAGQRFLTDALSSGQRRDAALRRVGLEVLRFDNLEVLKETDAVLERIRSVAQRRIAPDSARPGRP